MKIEEIKKRLEASRKYEEDLDRITARLLIISKQKTGRISADEARQLVGHLNRLRLIEGYHQIEHFTLNEAEKEYRKGEKTSQIKRLRSMAHALGFESGKKGRKENPKARQMLSMFNRLREAHSYYDTLKILAREFKLEDKYNDLRTVEKAIERAKKSYPELT